MKKLVLATLVVITGLTAMTSCGGKTMTPQELAFDRRVTSLMRGGVDREMAIQITTHEFEAGDKMIKEFTDGINGKTVILE